MYDVCVCVCECVCGLHGRWGGGPGGLRVVECTSVSLSCDEHVSVSPEWGGICVWGEPGLVEVGRVGLGADRGLSELPGGPCDVW